MTQNDIYLDKIANLPPAPTLAAELLSLFKDPDRDLEHIVKLVSFDPALTAAILRRCNSAFFAAEHPASNVFEALTRLGFYEVYCIVATLLVTNATSVSIARDVLNVDQLCEHLITTALAAAAIAELIDEPKETAFTAGLLHDIGKLALAAAEGQRYGHLLNSEERFGKSLIEDEQDSFGVNHASLGGCLLARWKLPTDISSAVLLHHNSHDFQALVKLAANVQVADMIAHQLTSEIARDSEHDATFKFTLQRLDLKPDDVPDIIALTKASLGQFSGLSS